MMQRNYQPARLPNDECPLCSRAMDSHHCSLVCPNCGYREDCSDVFRSGPIENAPEERQPAKPALPGSYD
jgi:uncharacterized Zn finger protein (UPF0148 family)